MAFGVAFSLATLTKQAQVCKLLYVQEISWIASMVKLPFHLQNAFIVRREEPLGV